MTDSDLVWDLERLRAVAGGSTVRCEGSPEDVRHAMAVLGSVATAAGDGQPLAAQLGSFHPEDREQVLLAWRAALDEPGELTEATGRQTVEGVWRTTRVRFVNLIQTDLRLMVAMTSDLGEVPTDETPRPGVFDPVPGTPASWALIHLGLDGLVSSASGTVEDLLGFSCEELVGQRLTQLVHPDDRNAATTMGSVAVASPDVARALSHRILRRDGSEVWVESTTTYDPDHQEIQALVTDISVRLAQESALEASHQEIHELAEEFRLLAEEIPSGAFRADAAGSIRFANGRFRALAGLRRVDRLRDLATPSNAPLVDRAVALAVEQATNDERIAVEPVQVEFRSAQGGPLQLRINATTVSTTGDPRLVGVLSDATPTVELRTRARTDGLTGLLNRAALDDLLTEALAEGTPLSVLFIDLDRFKHVNDEYGHHVGDEVLQTVARRFRTAIRATDDLSRYGGDEFVVICRTDDPGVVSEMGNRLASALTEPITFRGGQWAPAASVGVASARPGDDPRQLLRRADESMYRSKAADSDGPCDENSV